MSPRACHEEGMPREGMRRAHLRCTHMDILHCTPHRNRHHTEHPSSQSRTRKTTPRHSRRTALGRMHQQPRSHMG